MEGNCFILLVVFALSSVTMCDKQELRAVVQGNAKFTKNLYNLLAQSPGNVFFSPISAHAVLSLAYQAAKGETKEAFASTLHVPEPEVAAEGYNTVMQHLNQAKDVLLLIANKIYVKKGYTLQPGFKDVVEKKFSSELEQVNFEENAKAAKTINTWVERKTNNKIKDLISPDSLDAFTRAVLVNAIYFKGDWLNKFDPANTKTETFYKNDNETVDVQMMFRKGNYMYKDDASLDAKVLELPYKNKNLSLIVVLPNKRDGIADLEKKLAETDLSAITDDMFKVEVNVRLPKFKIETTLNLKESLQKLGLGVIFGADADFSGMIESPEPLYVSEVIQKAFIEVNEEGAEAAAATGVHITSRKAMLIRPTQDFYADHQFLFILAENQKRKGRSKRMKFSFPIFFGKLAGP